MDIVWFMLELLFIVECGIVGEFDEVVLGEFLIVVFVVDVVNDIVVVVVVVLLILQIFVMDVIFNVLCEIVRNILWEFGVIVWFLCVVFVDD